MQLAHQYDFSAAARVVEQSISDVRKMYSSLDGSNELKAMLEDTGTKESKTNNSIILTQQLRPATRSTQTKRSRNMPRALALSENGNLEELKAMHRDSLPIVEVSDKHGSCALHWAAGQGHLEVCKFLVEIMADVLQTQQHDGR